MLLQDKNSDHGSCNGALKERELSLGELPGGCNTGKRKHFWYSSVSVTQHEVLFSKDLSSLFVLLSGLKVELKLLK